MLFVTVGSDGPFDRLISAVDRWAGETGRKDVFAQIGDTRFQPAHVEYRSFLEPPEFNERFARASVVVAHAGMGTILSALRHQKPILIMPRRASLGEQRNEHQLATARHLLELGKVTVAFDETELRGWLDRLDQLAVRDAAGPFAGPELTHALRAFIDAD